MTKRILLYIWTIPESRPISRHQNSNWHLWTSSLGWQQQL